MFLGSTRLEIIALKNNIKVSYGAISQNSAVPTRYKDNGDDEGALRRVQDYKEGRVS